MTVDSAPSAAPRQVQGRAVNSTIILVTWSPPPVARQNGVVVHYRLLYVAADRDHHVGGSAAVRGRGRDVTRSVQSVIVPGTSQLSHIITALDRFTQYKIWIAASTRAGEGPLSDVVVVQTDEDGQ